MPQPVFDRQEQYDQIASGVLRGERIIAVYDAVGAGTGFLAVTDRRVIIQDTSFVGKQVAITSLPYGRISTVSVLSNKNWAGAYFSSSIIAIGVGHQTYQVQFRGVEKAHHVHDIILNRITDAPPAPRPARPAPTNQ